ncbi:major facilitator superfamily transporter [Ophiostoma piceae UAMH 11346]|uniref:Major facilitator superfamily transporter n=1 Tax=Ophiostoma piceae (strain UAMH 11346) TaxID=1262450 RepID=S3DAE7_OPHP1|nr:major facilitator superfamily transporter [Ophiostoma piceae UAMH 11346]
MAQSTPPPEGSPSHIGIDAETTTAATTPVLGTNQDEKSPHTSINANNAATDPPVNALAYTPAAPQSQAEKMTTIQIVLLMSALCMSVFLAALDMTIVTTALPTIAEDFGSSAGFVWVGSAFMLGSAAATASWGKFSDVFGRKPVLLCANLVFLLGCALCGAAKTLPTVIAGRAVQGIGAGGLLTLVNIIIGDLFSARERGKYYGMIGMVWATAGALGPVVGGALTNNVSWRWCFYINLPVSGTAFFIILAILRLPTPKTPILVGLKAIDWLGSLTITGGTLMLLMGLQFGGTSFPWRSATVICLIIFGFLTLAIFGFIEHFVAKFPVVPTHLYRSRSNLAVLLVCLFHGLSFTQSNYYLPTYFQAVLGASPLMSGVYLLALSLGVSVCAATSGIYLKKTGRYMDPIILGFVLAVLGSGLLYNLPTGQTTPSAASAWSRIIIYQIIAGMGIGLNFQPPLVALQSNVPPQNNASATASFALMRSIAAAISVVVGSAAFSNKMTAQYDTILAAVGGDAATANLLTGSNAQANLFLVDSLPSEARKIVRKALYTAIQEIWIQTVCFSAAGLFACFFIKRKQLQYTHETVKTGIEGEIERRRIALARKGKKKATANNNKEVPKTDLEA